MSKKVLFIDRDGTIIIEPEDFQIDTFEKLEFFPKAISSLARIAKELDYILVMVTNQDGLGTASFPKDAFYQVQNFIIQTLKNEGVEFEDIYIDSSFECENKDTRKPGVGMLGKYIYGDYDLSNSFVIGDRKTDVQLAKNLGAKSILLATSSEYSADLTTLDWNEIYEYLKDRPRTTTITRNTLETKIKIDLNIDGSGKNNINTGINFLNHMLEQIAKHAYFDLNVNVVGDIAIDDHHTIEDTALSLGKAFKEVLGSKKGIERYGFCLPMDDCLAQVAIDFGGRSWLVWDVEFARERVGDLSTEMVCHFFKSFSDEAKCNLNIKCEGQNEHHKIESIFKAFAKSLKMAVAKNTHFQIPSTKGIL